MTATYLNRLSDLLFVLARCANLPGGDVLWQPGGGREQSPRALNQPDCSSGDLQRLGSPRRTAPKSHEVGRGQATLTLKPGGLDSSQARTAV